MRGGRYGRGYRADRHRERAGGHGGEGRFSRSHARSAARREPATKKHTIGLFEGTEVFEAPKPRTLVQHIPEIAANPGDSSSTPSSAPAPPPRPPIRRGGGGSASRWASTRSPTARRASGFSADEGMNPARNRRPRSQVTQARPDYARSPGKWSLSARHFREARARLPPALAHKPSFVRNREACWQPVDLRGVEFSSHHPGTMKSNDGTGPHGAGRGAGAGAA